MKVQTFLIAVLAASSSSLATPLLGSIRGGGGQGVVCGTGPNQTVELLDLWEWETLHPESPISPVSTDVASAVDFTFQRLKNSMPLVMGCDDQSTDQECFIRVLRAEAELFLHPNSHVIRLHGKILTPTEDAYETIRPTKECTIEQIVNYQIAGPILINQDLYEKLNPTQQVALIAHEAYYSFLRRSYKEKTSIRVRRAIGYVMSGGTFHLPPSELPKKFVSCSSENNGDRAHSNQLVFFPGTDPASGQQANFARIYRLGGSPGIGIEVDTKLNYVKMDFRLKNPLAHICPRKGLRLTAEEMNLPAPVESDRSTNLFFDCEDGRLTITLNSYMPGESDQISSVLKCSVTTKQ